MQPVCCQEPGAADEIETCVRTRFSATFRMLEKVSVNGPNTHPVWRWLRLMGSADGAAIPWNFHMFLVSKDGATCTRYPNSRHPSEIRDDVIKALDATAAPEASNNGKPAAAPADTVDSPASVLTAGS